jgi:hypothetical protein
VPLAILCLLYLVPTVVAHERKHKDKEVIFLINLFLGWTILGWVLALAWALSGRRKSQ